MRGGIVERENDIGVLRYARDRGRDAQPKRQPVVDRPDARLEAQTRQMLCHRPGHGSWRGKQMPALLHVTSVRGGEDVGSPRKADRQATVLRARPQMSAQRVQVNHDGGIRMGDARRERTDCIDGATAEHPECGRRSERARNPPAVGG